MRLGVSCVGYIAPAEPPTKEAMEVYSLDLEEKIQLIVKNTEELVTKEELRSLLEENPHPHAYWGFECSGLMHIGMGLVCGSKIKDLIKAGFKFTVFLADWHSWINNKLGGKMENIKLCGEYFKQCFRALGVKGERVRFLWASDIVDDIEYWEKVIRIAKSVTLRRIRRALPIMGRTLDASDIEAAWIFYPCMQAADIFHMKVDVACAGIDQRKVHMLTRDVSEKIGFRKPICLHTPLLVGLKGPKAAVKGKFDENEKIDLSIRSKMSKSIPGSAIFVHDSPEEIKSKIKAAYCPPKIAEGNPIMEIAKYIIFSEMETLEVRRKAEYGGTIEFNSYEELEKIYIKGELHPLDLKEAIANALIEILEPVRRDFERNPELLNRMLQLEVTR